MTATHRTHYVELIDGPFAGEFVHAPGDHGPRDVPEAAILVTRLQGVVTVVGTDESKGHLSRASFYPREAKPHPAADDGWRWVYLYAPKQAG